MMQDRKRLMQLVCLVAVVMIANAGLTIALLYNAAWDAQCSRLVETVRSQSCLIEAIANFHLQEHNLAVDTKARDWAAHTLALVRDALNRFEQLNQTSEFTLATRDEDRIAFLIRLRHQKQPEAGETTLSVPWQSKTAEPMRLALSGKSGTVVGIDYRGEPVLAAYEPIPDLGWGIVAKIDVAEIRAPFVKAGGIVAILVSVAVILATTLIVRWTEPVIRNREASESKVRAILAGARDGIITFSHEGRIESYNQAAQEMFGYPDCDLAGINAHDLLHIEPSPSSTDNGTSSGATPLSNTSGGPRIVIARRADGSTFSAETTVNAAVMHDRPLYTAVIRDTSDSEDVQKILRESKTFLQTIIDSLPDGLMVIDLNHQVLLANAAIRKQLCVDGGTESCTTCYRSAHNRDTPCDGPDHPCPLRDAVRTKSPIIVEHTHTRADGTKFPVEIVAAPVFDDSGEVVRVIECCRDLTERRQAEDQLRESELRLRELYQASRDGYIMVDLEKDRIIECNAAFCEMIGYTEEELRDVSNNALSPEGYHEADRRIIEEEVLTRGYSELYEKEYRRKDGVLFPAEVQRYICRDKNSLATRMWAFVRDVSERKCAEERLKSVNAELEARNEEISQLVYTVSHDLKSPLVTIQGFTGRIQRDAEAGQMERIAGHIQRVQNAAERMAKLLDDLLEFNRIGRITAKPEWTNLQDLAREIVAAQEVKLKDCDVTIHIQEDMPPVFGDKGRLAQLLDNLVGNALEYGSDACDATIEIGAIKPDEDEVHIFVQDNGPGIPAEFHSRIFELFQRLRHDSPGSGVGLSVVKRIAEVHGGRAWVDSRPGEGATFWVSLMQPHESPIEASQFTEVAHSV